MTLVLFSNFPCGHKSIEGGIHTAKYLIFFSLLRLLFLVSLDIMVSMAFLLQQGGRPVEISGSLSCCTNRYQNQKWTNVASTNIEIEQIKEILGFLSSSYPCQPVGAMDRHKSHWAMCAQKP